MGLLNVFTDRIFVPEPVAREIQGSGPDDITVRALRETNWIEIVPTPRIPEEIRTWGLGVGESSVLALAYSKPGIEAIIDDLAGRRCASALGIPLRGTLGIVLLAKKRGLIPEARPIMEDLIRAGLYLSDSVLNKALRRVGE